MANRTDGSDGYPPAGSEIAGKQHRRRRSIALPLTFEMGGAEHGGTSERLACVWNLRLAPPLKLAAIHIANGGLRSRSEAAVDRLAAFVGCTWEEAGDLVVQLEREGLFV